MGAGGDIALFADDDVISAADAMDSLFYFHASVRLMHQTVYCIH